MTFNSLHFLLFFPFVCALHFLIPARWRWIPLLAASCYFYMALVPSYILILAGVILIDFLAAIALEEVPARLRRPVLLASFAANLGLLFVFKYSGFFCDNLNALARLLHWNYAVDRLSFFLPLGLSFHTFQSLSYTIEVYRGKQRAERHLGIYALYVLFFPQAVAGPIERPQGLLPQFRETHAFDPDRVTQGLRQMLWGFFQKIVVADRLASLVDLAYSTPGAYTGPALLLATMLFSFQIYADFCGYSDIALGAARILGFRLSRNFQRPYLAVSVVDFWHRWHISLSTWFRDYVYIPLGGSSERAWRRYLNIAIVFLASGLWHGAEWTFVVWGAVNGLYLIAYQILLPVRLALARALPSRAAHHALGTASTFLAISLSWIFFRAASLTEARLVLWRILTLASDGNGVLASGHQPLLIALGGISALMAADMLQEAKLLRHPLELGPSWARFAAYVAVSLCLLNLGTSDQVAFIYFQF